MRAIAAAPGIMHLVPGAPNPNGADGARLFLLAGDPAAAPVSEIIPVEGVEIPPLLSAGARLPDPYRLHILHFNDLHGRVCRSTHQPALSRLIWRVRELRRRSRDVLFLSGGDDLAGGVLGELQRLSPPIHAGYRLYSAAGVDAGVVGNHDLDAGAGSLAGAIERDACFPLLSANLCASPPLVGRVHAAALLVVKGLRVGIIGLTTRAEVRSTAGVCLSHPLTAIHNLLPAFRPWCDVLIVLSHLGRSLASSTTPTCDAGDLELAASLPAGSVDLIVGGHTHEALNESGLSVANLVNGIAIVQAGTMGRFLGEVEITVGRRVSVTSVRLTPAEDLPPDRDWEREQVQPLLAQTQPILARRLGRVADHPDLSAGAGPGESALANLISDALVDRCQAAGYPVDLAAIDSSSICCGLPVGGELTFGDWFALMPYADTVRLCRLTGQQLAELLDDNARRADRPGEPHVERGFLQFSRQVRYAVQLGDSRAAAHAVQVTLDGQPLDRQLDRVLLVACPSFVREAAVPWERHAAGQLGLPAQDLICSSCADTDLLVRDLLVAHLSTHGGATEDAGVRRDGRLRLV